MDDILAHPKTIGGKSYAVNQFDVDLPSAFMALDMQFWSHILWITRVLWSAFAWVRDRHRKMPQAARQMPTA